MPTQKLIVGVASIAQPGDDFTFTPPDASTQYHFEVSPPYPGMTIGVWKGPAVKPNGVARNATGKPYVDHVCGAGNFTITVWGATGPYSLKTSANSWWKKVFGWG